MTRRDFRRVRAFFASMGTLFEHGNGLKSRLVVADEDGNSLHFLFESRSALLAKIRGARWDFRSQIQLNLKILNSSDGVRDVTDLSRHYSPFYPTMRFLMIMKNRL